ncbi:MAG: nucleotide-binding protein, partial [Deltaproteobacteria bacterium]|nr:nucleotide-binding protein [Deltaproteobacteria bacterium]
RVVKFNTGIMGRNWIHIQDGSGSEGSNDLTVTTEDTVQVGDLVVIRGTLKMNQDFGSGYSYEILVENAKASVE